MEIEQVGSRKFILLDKAIANRDVLSSVLLCLLWRTPNLVSDLLICTLGAIHSPSSINQPILTCPIFDTITEFATVGVMSKEQADKDGIDVDVYRAGLEHNDRAILESSNVGFVKIITRKDSDEILGATIVADRAGDMINEISLAMKEKIGLRALGRNIHSYPTTSEAIQGCGLQYINKRWTRFD